MSDDLVRIHFPERAHAALIAVLGHEPTDRLLDATVTVLAALQGEEVPGPPEHEEALTIAVGTAMPDDEREIAAIVAQNEPLPHPHGEGEVDAERLLRHTLELAAEEASNMA